MYSHIKEQIAELSSAIGRIEDKAAAENRQPSAKEAGLIAEMEIKINNLRKELPVGGPLTLRDFGGSRAISAGGNTGGYESVGEIMQDLYRKTKGEGMSPRLEALQVRAGINETVPSQGSFGVPEQLVYKSFAENLQDTVLLQLCDKVPMTSDKLGIPIFGDDSHSTSAPFGIAWDQIPESGSFGDAPRMPSGMVRGGIELEAGKDSEERDGSRLMHRADTRGSWFAPLFPIPGPPWRVKTREVSRAERQ